MIGLSLAMTAVRVRSAQCAHLGREPFPEPPDGRLARLDQQLGAVAADVESQEVEPVLGEVDDLRLVLVEGQTPGRQPFRKPRLDLFGLLTGVAEHDHIVGVPDQRPVNLAWSHWHRSRRSQ